MKEFNFKNLGESIHSIRVKLGISQKDLASGICTQSQISKIETGEISPYIHTLVKIAERLGINTSHFINQISKEHYEFVSQSKNFVREHIKKKDYKEVRRLINKLEKHPSFQNIEERQFIHWHRGVCIYYLENDSTRAIDVLKEALDMKDSIQATEQDIQIINSIGIIHGEKEKWEEAKNSFLRAQEIYSKALYLLDFTIMIRIYYNLSKIYYKLNNNHEALNVANKGINLALEKESSYLLGELLYQKGFIYAERGDVSQGIVHLQKAGTIFALYEKESYIQMVQDKLALFRQ
jgi:transcriptional regulator with XRE-family HTH domain